KLRNQREEIDTENKTQQEIRSELEVSIKQNKQNINTLQGFPVLDGSAEAPLYFESGKINRINMTGLIISSDGLFMHQEKGALVEVDPIARLVEEVSLVGIDGYIAYL